MEGELNKLEGTIFHFWIKDGTIETAHKVAKVLNENIESIGLSY